MAKKPSNPQAFPCLETESETLQGEDYPRIIEHTGMALRDYFAAKAIQGLVSHIGKPRKYQERWGAKDDFKEYSEISYQLADAMLREREK